jgi:ABC-type multidrug transport system fused ATPase/permease subunit
MLIQEAINRLVGRKTIIVVSHRLDSIRNCDNIVLMEKGQIVACGVHDKLLQTSQTYARLWSLQQENLRWTLARPLEAPQQMDDGQGIQEARV